jgi:hypothetical protein
MRMMLLEQEKNEPNWESANKIHLSFELAGGNKKLMLFLLLEYFECALSRFEYA